MKSYGLTTALLAGLATACTPAPEERLPTQNLQLVLADSFLVNTIGSLQLIDQHPVTQQWLVLDQSKHRLLFTNARGSIEREINDEINTYGFYQPYGIGFYGDSAVVLASVRGLSIISLSSQPIYQLKEVINKSPRTRYGIAVFRQPGKEYVVGLIKYAPEQRKRMSLPYYLSRQYALDNRAITVFDRQANQSEVIIPYAPEGEMVAGGRLHLDMATYVDFDTAR
ncbi:MAG: hypothetical protein MUC97_17980 [Bernardetiaceae bacterium]|nr:hypothetical protein [Bernardetiaceae bacterium]